MVLLPVVIYWTVLPEAEYCYNEAIFRKLQHRLWNNRHVSIRVKCKVNRAVVLSCLLYGAEAWTIYRTQVKKLNTFMMRQLRDIMSVKWYDKITNEEILRRANLLCMANILIERNLRWVGHVHRMDNDRPTAVLAIERRKKKSGKA